MKKRKYLYRLAMSVFFIVLLPMIIVMIYFGKYSYEKVETANEEYQNALMDFYMMQLDQMVMELREHAASICAQSKERTSIFWEKDSTDNYWYYQAITEMKNKHHNYPSSAFRIYYYDDQRILSEDGLLTTVEYFNIIVSSQPEQEEYLKGFFDENRYKEFTLCISGTEKQREEDKLLIGFCTTLGRHRDKVMLMYEYTESDIEALFESSYIEKGFEGSLWNTNNDFSFFFADHSGEDYRDDVKKLMESKEGLDNQDTFLVKESNVHPIVLIGYMNENSPRNMTLAFLDNMLSMVSVAMAVVLLGYLLILYIAYKPVFRLTTKLELAEGDEFETIGKALDDRSARIEEQEVLLLDFLLNNLLYKVPISKSKLKMLGIELAECYTVFLLDGYVLHDAESKKLISEAAKRFRARMFVMDLEGENRTVFVLFLNNGQSDEVKEWLTSRCSGLGVQGSELVGGKTVQDIKEIWSCLSFCEEELNRAVPVEEPVEDEQRSNSSREMKRIKLREDILTYVDEHYRDIGLSQASLADRFNISTYTLSRIFRNDVGIGFVTYVNAKRVEYAKEMLLTTKENVHDIAVKSGFDNDNNFYKVFKANTGMSPTTFRES